MPVALLTTTAVAAAAAGAVVVVVMRSLVQPCAVGPIVYVPVALLSSR